MARIYTTEITSDHIASDNPIHQRLLKAYVVAKDFVLGDILEVGCGEGRGIPLLMEQASSYTAIDKLADVVQGLQAKFPAGKFLSGNIPPLAQFADNSFDRIFSFQVIEHIHDDQLFLKEISRVLKPGGCAFLTTPNRPLSLSRNPWHVREYTAGELSRLAAPFFTSVEMKGISGNEKVMEYHARNRQSVNKLMRWDIFDLQHRLPAWLLRLPYETMNRLNRNKLKENADALVMSIGHEDFLLTNDAETSLDLFLIAKK